MADDFVPLYQRITTGQLRRRPTELLIQKIIERIQTENAGAVSVACLDIDGFTGIEDKHGYTTADSLLDVIARHVKDQAPDKVNHFARYVRDAFLVVYDGLSLEEAFLETEILRRQLSQTGFTVEDKGKSVEINVVFSGGVATYPGDPEDHHEVISMAEEAVRRAYENEGNRTMLARAVNMTPKTSHYSPNQLERLRVLRNQLGRSEASLLREALDDLLRKYDQRDIRRGITGE